MDVTQPLASVRVDTSGKPTAPIGTIGAGMVVPYDFALDRELWRWVPDPVTLLLTRTPRHAMPVSVHQAEAVSDPAVLAACVHTITETAPDVVAYVCTSGSFVAGVTGETAIRAALVAAGVPRAVTTSGALLQAVHALGVRRLAVATPYDALITERLQSFLAQAGVRVVSCSSLGLTERIWALDYDQVAALIRGAARDSDCDAVFVSCTNVPTFDLIPDLEDELGVPVLSANQVTMWATLGELGLPSPASGQRLLTAQLPRPGVLQEAR